MGVCKLELGKINGNVFVFIERKNIKNIHLKVYRDLTIKLSVPTNVSDSWISDFLEKRKDWINTQLYKFKQSAGINNMSYLINGYTIQILGKDKRVYLQKGNKEVVEDINKITIYLEDTKNLGLATKIFTEWWRETSLKLYLKEMQKFYNNIFKKYSLDFPKVKIKKMKTMWGNCNVKNKTITFNEYLYKANLLGIQYVILHEMTHLLYPNHNNDFYNFLTIHMPDWKERKKILDIEVVQGIN